MQLDAIRRMTGLGGGETLIEVAPDVTCLQVLIVNAFFVGRPGRADGGWALVDAGLRGTAGRFRKAAEQRFGPGARPAAIILTHGHFDHVGALRELAEAWDVLIYAHPLEMPYLTGRSAYPPPDPTVGGGAMARLSFLYPKGPYDFSDRIRPLPSDGSVPGMPGWRWIHTPGHTPGHVSLFRDSDRLLIAGDAFVTTKQESARAVLTQRAELHGPPAYYTPDWTAARASVQALAALGPEIAATGHGIPMRGPDMLRQLETLAHDFDRLAVPSHGRYVRQPAFADREGVVSVPPPAPEPLSRWLAAIGIGAAAGLIVGALTRRSRHPELQASAMSAVAPEDQDETRRPSRVPPEGPG